MTTPVLVDSNIYIGLLRSGLDPAEILGNWIGAGDLATCGMIRLEVERGLRIEKIRHRMAAFFDVLIKSRPPIISGKSLPPVLGRLTDPASPSPRKTYS